MLKIRPPTCFIYNLFVLVVLVLTGCQTPKPTFHLSHPEIKLAQNSGFKTSIIKTTHFELTNLIKKTNTESSKIKKLVIYIEGDGRSWIKKHILSKDPTPPYALGLRLAIQDPRNNQSDAAIAYLARPCQFTQQKPNPESCPAKYWSSDRFSEVVISNMNEAVDKIKADSGLGLKDKIELIGYSGGTAVVILVAARRNDVDVIRTVAGDLNHEMMSEYHHTTPLSNCLNPINFTDKLTHIKQIHYIGTKDKIVPKKVTENFISDCNQYLSKDDSRPIIIPVNATHQKGWEAQWHLICKNPN